MTVVRAVLSLVVITSHSDLLEGGSSVCRSCVSREGRWRCKRWKVREVREVRGVRRGKRRKGGRYEREEKVLLTHNVVHRSSDDVNSVSVWPHNSQVVLQVNGTGISRPDRVHSAKFRVHHTLQQLTIIIYVNLLHILHGQEVGDSEEHCHRWGHTPHMSSHNHRLYCNSPYPTQKASKPASWKDC